MKPQIVAGPWLPSSLSPGVLWLEKYNNRLKIEILRVSCNKSQRNKKKKPNKQIISQGAEIGEHVYVMLKSFSS